MERQTYLEEEEWQQFISLCIIVDLGHRFAPSQLRDAFLEKAESRNKNWPPREVNSKKRPTEKAR